MPTHDQEKRLGPKLNARAVAVNVLLDVLEGGKTLSDVLADQRDSQDKALIQELSYGVMRWKSRLDAIAGALLEKPLRRKDKDVYLALLVGLYQLTCTRIPPHAAVDETVAVARSLAKPWAARLINGVLRQYQRNVDPITQRIDQEQSTRLAFPSWLLNRLRNAWPKHWESLAHASNQRPPFALRVNQQRISRKAYLELLGDCGISAAALSHATDGIRLERPLPVEKLPGFADGLVSVQDEAAQLAAGLLALHPGHRVLDACAAPGGKTCHILETESKLSAVTAVDIDTQRLQRLESNLRRLGLKARLFCGDAAAPLGEWTTPAYDRILLDVPCSATGVIRRHPDIKWLRTPKDIENLLPLQARMLDAIWSLLDTGGMLLYATCSVLPEENEIQVAAFLKRTPNARERKIQADWGISRAVGKQIIPGVERMDGFYYACLDKIQ